MNKFSNRMLGFALLAFIGLFWFNSAAAQQLDIELKADAVAYYDANGVLSVEAYLAWIMENSDDVTEFKVYWADGKANSMDDFTDSQTFVVGQDSLLQNQENYWGVVLYGLQSKTGEITFLVTAKIGGLESKYSNYFNCLIRRDDPYHWVEFKTYPEETVKINTEYVYEFEAVADDDSYTIGYEAQYLPEGAEFDAENRTITFTPTEAGQYFFMLVANAYGEGQIIAQGYQSWMVNVIECDVTSSISGTVEVEDADSLTQVYGFVTAYKQMYFEQDSINWGKFYYAGQAEIIDGEYTIENLDKGEYYLEAMVFDLNSKGQYLPEWFDNAKDMTEATPVILDCADAATADFYLEKMPEPVYHKVSGTVKDAETGDPIQWAIVEFYGNDPNGYGYSSYASTDEDGYYEAQILEGVSYIAYANSGYRGKKDYDTIPYQDIYLPQYWDGKSDPSEADPIVAYEDVENINFNLEKYVFHENLITGIVVGEDEKELSDIMVFAYLIDGENVDESNYQYHGFMGYTDYNGKFYLNNLVPGTYVLFAVPARPMKYAPGFYMEDDLAILTWEDATQIEITEDGEFGPYTITLPLFENIFGEGIVKGKVSSEIGKVKVDEEVQGNEDGLQGAFVHVTDYLGARIKTSETNSKGNFELKGLANGTYTVTVDKVGFKSTSFQITITDDNKVIEHGVTLVKDDNTTDVNDDVLSPLSITVYPNPSVESFNVQFNSISGKSDLQIFDNMGRVVYQQTVNSTNGANYININSDNFTNGTYYIRLSNGNSTVLTPVVIAK